MGEHTLTFLTRVFPLESILHLLWMSPLKRSLTGLSFLYTSVKLESSDQLWPLGSVL